MKSEEFIQPRLQRSGQLSPVGSTKPNQGKDAAKKRVEELTRQMKKGHK